jgi:hypothetical protein
MSKTPALNGSAPCASSRKPTRPAPQPNSMRAASVPAGGASTLDSSAHSSSRSKPVGTAATDVDASDAAIASAPAHFVHTPPNVPCVMVFSSSICAAMAAPSRRARPCARRSNDRSPGAGLQRRTFFSRLRDRAERLTSAVPRSTLPGRLFTERAMKRALIVIAVLVVVLVVAVVVSIGKIARAAVERGGTYALGVPTKLDSASVHPFDGNFGLSKLTIENPPGFNSPHFLALESGAIEVKMGSLTSDVIEAPKLELDGLVVYLERTEGKTNYKAILDNLKRFESERGKKEQAPEEEGKKFIVREIVLRNTQIHADLIPVGGSLTKTSVTLPELRLTNVGSAEDGASIADLIAEVVAAVLKAAAQQTGLAGEVLQDLGSALKGLEGLGAKLEQEVGGALQDMSKSVEGTVKKIGEGLGGLLEKKN